MKSSIFLTTTVLALFFSLSLYSQVHNTNLGTNAGNSGNDNTSIGYTAGDDVTGDENTFLGASAGLNNTTGYRNIYLGFAPGYSHTTGTYNIFAGWKTGFYNYSGIGNIMLGMMNGFNNNGSYNVFVGHNAGRTNTGSGNVFLGNKAGWYETGSNKLFIDNYSDTIPLIYGEFDSDLVSIHNRLGIGISSFPSNISLMVNGTVKAKEVIITTDGFPDYVFDPGYELLSLENLEEFIRLKGHLPNIPSEAEVLEEGKNMAEMDKLLLEKVEEQTLYLIELSKQIESLQEENLRLQHEVQALKDTD